VFVRKKKDIKRGANATTKFMFEQEREKKLEEMSIQIAFY
jgi:hypothetical protein